MKEILKNPYVLSGIAFILALIAIAFNIWGNSGTKVILQPDTTSTISDTRSQVDALLPWEE